MRQRPVMLHDVVLPNEMLALAWLTAKTASRLAYGYLAMRRKWSALQQCGRALAVAKRTRR